MKTIKKLIIATILINSLSPVISICTRESDDKVENVAAAVAMTLEQIAEETRIQTFVAQKAAHIAPFLPKVLVSLMLDYVKPTEKQVEEANTTLAHAIEKREDSQALIDALNEGADINKKQKLINDSYAYTPLYRSVDGCQSHIIQTLIDNKADINCMHIDGTPLSLACSRADIDSVKILIKNNAPVNTKSPDGTTPLYNTICLYQDWQDMPHGVTVRNNLKKMITMLILADADPYDEIIPSWQYTPGPIRHTIENALQKKYERAQQLTHLLLKTDTLQQFLPKSIIINIINDYAKPAC